MTMEMTADRVLPFEGVHNFRDYGGYQAIGGRLRSGLLYRSAQHRSATPADLVRVADLDLAAVIDLRGVGERQAMPCPRPEGFSARVIFIDEETAGLAPHVAAAFQAGSADQARRAMLASYAELPFRPALSRALARYFATLAEVDGATLVHCVAGKDRTGLGVALLHTMLGVHRDEVMADFLLTNTAGDPEARIAAGARHLRAAYGTLDDASLRVLMNVEPGYLDAAFGAIMGAHGSVDAYLADHLGVTPAQREAIAAKLVA